MLQNQLPPSSHQKTSPRLSFPFVKQLRCGWCGIDIFLFLAWICIPFAMFFYLQSGTLSLLHNWLHFNVCDASAKWEGAVRRAQWDGLRHPVKLEEKGSSTLECQHREGRVISTWFTVLSPAPGTSLSTCSCLCKYLRKEWMNDLFVLPSLPNSQASLHLNCPETPGLFFSSKNLESGWICLGGCSVSFPCLCSLVVRSTHLIVLL